VADASDPSSQNSTHPFPPTDAAPALNPNRRVFVHVALAIVAVVFVTLVAVLYYKSWWMHPPVPDAALIVQGNEEVAGAVVSVSGPIDQPRSRTMSAESGYACEFHLPPGNYYLRISVAGSVVESTVELKSTKTVTVPFGRTHGGVR
jgi:hypothetical protein